MGDGYDFLSEQAKRLETNLPIIEPIIQDRKSDAIKHLLDDGKVDSVPLEIRSPLSFVPFKPQANLYAIVYT